MPGVPKGDQTACLSPLPPGHGRFRLPAAHHLAWYTARVRIFGLALASRDLAAQSAWPTRELASPRRAAAVSYVS